jgi:hypothetical protein
MLIVAMLNQVPFDPLSNLQLTLMPLFMRARMITRCNYDGYGYGYGYDINKDLLSHKPLVR